MPPSAITFDLDGTLYDAGRVRRRFALSNLFALKAIRAAMDARASLRGAAFDSGEAYFAAESEAIAARLGASAEDARRRADTLLGPRLCDTLRAVGPRAGALEALTALAAERPVAVISDYAPADKLAALGLDALPWACLIAADATGALKPHPRPFLAAAEALGLAPAEITHIGDREDTDGEGARAAGMRYVHLSPGERLADAIARARAD